MSHGDGGGRERQVNGADGFIVMMMVIFNGDVKGLGEVHQTTEVGHSNSQYEIERGGPDVERTLGQRIAWVSFNPGYWICYYNC